MFERDKVSGPWKVIDRGRNISVEQRMNSEGTWLDLQIKGKKIRLDYGGRMGGGLKGNEYYWDIIRAEGDQTTEEEREEIAEILENAIRIRAQTQFRDREVKTGVDFSKTIWKS